MAFTRKQAKALAQIVVTGTDAEIIAAFQAEIPTASKGWKRAFQRAIDTISGKRTCNIFAKGGNSKLPFVAFSTLPQFTCPGAGDCLKFCYSFKSWQYPDAFVRQCLNTWAILKRPDLIAAQFGKLPKNITLRLYVDGDFDSDATFRFWMQLLKFRPDIATYGYSKSLEIVKRNADCVPANYSLNLSSGSIYDNTDLIQEIEQFEFTRGRFIAVKVDQPVDYDNPEYHREVRAKAASMGLGKVFSCPGKCGSCTGAGHVCGARKANGDHLLTLPVVIGIH